MDKLKIKQLINKERPIILDIGCYNGGDTLGFASIFRRGRIYAFEADPRSHKLFMGLSGWPNVKFYDFAISNVDGLVDFYIADPEEKDHHHCSGSVNEPGAHTEFFPDVPFGAEPIKVLSKKLDTWYKEEFAQDNFPDIDFIWADVNGGEEQLILGGLETLRLRTRYLYTEFSNDSLYKNQINKSAILSLLPNFDIIYEEYGDKGYGNVCLRNKRFV